MTQLSAEFDIDALTSDEKDDKENIRPPLASESEPQARNPADNHRAKLFRSPSQHLKIKKHAQVRDCHGNIQLFLRLKDLLSLFVL